MTAFLRDAACALRSFRATPAAVLAAIITIALGTGANTAVFAVAYGVLLRPLLCPEPSRIVVVSLHAPNGREIGVPLADISEWQRRVRAFDTTAAYSLADMTIRGLGEPRVVPVALVTPSFFDVLRVAPRAGRGPSASDPDDWMVVGSVLAGGPARTGPGDPALLGRSLTAGDRGLQVSAVMPRGFGFPSEDVAAWIPAAPYARLRLASGREVPRTFRVMARMKEGVSIEQAHDAAQRAFSQVAASRSDKVTIQVRTLDDLLFGTVRPVLNALGAAALLVLLVACGNVATLLVSRAMARNRDLAVRLALGASAWQLARATLVESLMIAVAGSTLGVALAIACVRLFVHAATGVVPRLDAIAIDPPVLAASVVTVIGVTLACGLAPAIHATRADFVSAFRGAHASASRGARTTRRALVVVQIAISIVLLSGAGLIARSVFGLLSDRGGANPDRALAAKLVLADTARFDLASRLPTIREVLRAVRALPGVESAAIGTNIPPRVSQITFSVEETTNGRSVTYTVHLASVTSGFFAALGARVLEGRGIDEADEARDGPVIVLSESAARLLSPGKSLVGRELPWPLPAGAGKGRRPLVVGVVADVKYRGLDAPASTTIYTRWADLPASVGHLLVRTSRDPILLVSTLRKTLRTVDPMLPVSDVRTLRQEYDASVADRRMRLIPAAGFAAVAIAVALVGLGGLMVRSVNERRRELAVRAVLGASPADAVGVVVREGVVLAAVGMILGLASAAAAARTIRSLLYGVSPLDPWTFAAVALLVSAAALATSFVAASRASRIDPVELLRLG